MYLSPALTSSFINETKMKLSRPYMGKYTYWEFRNQNLCIWLIIGWFGQPSMRKFLPSPEWGKSRTTLNLLIILMRQISHNILFTVESSFSNKTNALFFTAWFNSYSVLSNENVEKKLINRKRVGQWQIVITCEWANREKRARFQLWKNLVKKRVSVAILTI